MEGIRIIKLPPARMVTSGSGDLDRFDAWWSQVDKERRDRFFPRDFMWYEEGAKRLVWFYALPDEMTDTGGYGVVHFPGGLYAVAVSRDEDDADGERVYAGVKEWIRTSGIFALDEQPGRYTMFHVITPPEAFAAMGYRQLDLFVPVRVISR